MPPEATLEPPPLSDAPATPEGTAAAKTALQEAFDRVAPLKTKKGQVQPPPTQPKPAPEPSPSPEPTPEPDKPAAKQEELKLPGL